MCRSVCCPLCGDDILRDEYDRFGMCLDCFADEIAQNVNDAVLYDFLRDNSAQFKDYIADNYADCCFDGY